MIYYTPMRHIFCIVISVAVLSAAAQSVSGGDSFVRKQAYAELQRINGMLDVLESNNNSLSARIAKIEGGKGELGAVKSDIDSLRAEIAALRREMQNMRGEIIKELTGKVVEINKATQASVDAKIEAQRQAAARQQQAAARQQQAAQPSSYSGPAREYVVQSGDSLTLIAQAFGTKVSTIREMNNLKSDMIRVGQRLILPKN